MILDRASSIYAVLAVMLCTTGVPVRGADHWLDGHLIAPSRVETGTRGQFLAAGDVNGDGSQDLVVLGIAMTNSHLVVSTVLSDGQGTFLDPVITELSSGTSYRAVSFFSLADMNGDGKLDMVYGPPVGGGSNQVQIKYGDGLGAFAGGITLTTQSSASVWGATDLNLDGKPDVFIIDSSSIGIFENLGGGSFKPLTTKPFNLPTGDFVRSVTVADYDHNGQPDLVLNCSRSYPADPEGLAVNVVLNPTSDTVATKTLLFIPGVYTGQVIAVDLNHDQALDLAIATGTTSDAGGTLYVSFAQGGDSFSEPAQYTLPIGPDPVGAAISGPFLSAIDLEGTGYPAIFMGRADMAVVFRFDNLQNGTFASPTYLTGGATQCLTPVDLDSDGKVDLATATDDGGIALFLNRPGERLQQSPMTTYGTRPLATMGQASLDLNGDGNTDLMTPGGTLFYGDGLGNFTPGPYIYPGGTDVAMGDINGDGLIDAVYVFSNGLAYVYGQSGGSFSAPQYETNYWLTRVRINDIDKDGYPDVISFGSGTMFIRFGQSDHTLGPQVQYSTGISFDPLSHGPVFADVNGDGFLDILGTSGTTQVVYGGPGRTFSQGTLVTVPSGFTAYDVFLQDVNHDSKPDLLLGGKGAGLLLIVYSGDGHGQFTEMSRLTDPDGWKHAFTFFDFDGDDNVDFSACSEGGGLLFSSGQSNGTFGAYERALIATECSGIISTPLRRSEKRGAALASVWQYKYLPDQWGSIQPPGGKQIILTLRVRPRSRDRRDR